MPRKDSEARRQYHREYMRKWYVQNKQLQISRVRADRARRRRELAAFIDQFKRRPCADCGGDFPPFLMDFDHVNGDKRDDVCGMRMRTVSRETIATEIAKCEVVCANCHRARTRARRLGLDMHASQFVLSYGERYSSVLIY
jgi:hypothetical protein